MTSFGGLGIGLSFLFGCMVMVFAAELYYLLWVRKRFSKTNCLTKIGTQEVTRNQEDQDLELGASSSSSSSLIKLEGYREDNEESELTRLYNLRFLSTIKEETKEDLESEDGSRKCSKSRSFSDIALILTPLSSPPIKSQEFSFNPLFESEIKSMKSSPPPKFKFLRDAEEKLIRRLIEEAEKRKKSSNSIVVSLCDNQVIGSSCENSHLY
ncbi:uncharacterized protein LOC125875246 [Solanum stenotomum]|uniref:uncharacterized protein LOC125875246 n=1 Tax=Solanum stenotomum TaxID=172797 RepID=UPI0020D15384|nr:uncharacterized protein LOC125875246 [Solanum stenotomum]